MESKNEKVFYRNHKKLYLPEFQLPVIEKWNNAHENKAQDKLLEMKKTEMPKQINTVCENVFPNTGI